MSVAEAAQAGEAPLDAGAQLPETLPSSEHSSGRQMMGNSLASGVLLMLVLTVAQRVVGLARGVLVCRWLSPTDVGLWELALSFLCIAAPLAVIGLPGSFGRYALHYHMRGHLRMFLLRTTRLSMLLALMAVGAVALFRVQFSQLVFNSPHHADLMLVLAPCLAALVAFNYLQSLLTSLRLYHVYSLMQFACAVLFAALCVAWVRLVEWGAPGIVMAYGVSCFLAVAGALWFVRRKLAEMPADVPERDEAPFWRRLLPFAFWIWAADFVANSFMIVDRYMLVHFSGLDEATLLAGIGQYHSARLIPMLLSTVAVMVGSMVTPNLTAMWEHGQRDAARRKMLLIQKLMSLLLCTGGAAVLVTAPLFFNWLLRGKFGEGMAWLPMTLTYCIWFGLSCLGTCYLLCAEKAWLNSLCFGVGLTVNVATNLLLVPVYQFEGAILASILGNIAAFLAVCACEWKHGMRFDLGFILLALLPAGMCLGAIGASLICLAVAMLACFTPAIFSAQEKRQLLNLAQRFPPVRRFLVR